jgi:hypothetical protein
MADQAGKERVTSQMNLCVEETPSDLEIVGEGHSAGADTFESAIARIENAVAGSCAAQAEWPVRVATGLNAAVDFLIANPGAARALAIESRAGEPQEGDDYEEMIDRFAALLGAGAPVAERLPASRDRSIVTVLATVITCHLRSGTIDSLAKGDPDLVFLALLPYMGFAEAARWSSTLSS